MAVLVIDFIAMFAAMTFATIGLGELLLRALEGRP